MLQGAGLAVELAGAVAAHAAFVDGVAGDLEWPSALAELFAGRAAKDVGVVIVGEVTA